MKLYEYRESARLEYNSGMYRAREDGKAEGKVEVARKLLLSGMTIDAVAELTGLSVEQLSTIDK